MGNLRNKVKRYCLALVVFLLTFCFATTSFSEEAENIGHIGEEKIDAYNQTRCENESKKAKSILIRLGDIHFDPLLMVPKKKRGLKEIDAYSPGELGYYIVQFDGPIENSWKDALKRIGADLFDYIADFGFIIRLNSNSEQAVRRLPHVRWLGIYQPSYRISQSAVEMLTEEAEAEAAEGEMARTRFMVTCFRGEDPKRIKAEIVAIDGVILDTVITKWKITIKIEVGWDKIAKLPSISGVKWIEPEPERRLFNNESTDVMGVRSPRDTYGLYGAGQTVGICDTGLDQGSTNPANLHDDFEDGAGNSRVIDIFDRVGDGAEDKNSGHGTHVAGSVLGNGYMSGSSPLSDFFPSSSFAGIAPKAGLVFQAVEDYLTGYLTGIPSDLNILFSESDMAGADLHTNSWGASVSGMYTSDSENVDEYVWDNPDFLILFAAGNDGKDLDGDGVVDLYNLGSPATAKNCLTVGASEGNRPSGAGYDCSWGAAWPDEFSTNPVYSDHLSDDIDGLAAFSSRGPVLDGRCKPDILAPGTNILSVKSSLAYGTGWGGYDSYYMWMGGTSMSAPLTAGAAALMREYLIDVKGYTQPSAALIKAALINSAEDISPGQYGTGGTQEIPDPPVPNNVEGWGRLNLGNGVYPSSPYDIFYYDVQDSLGTGEYDEYTVTVADSGKPLKINLVWTDYPGSPVTQGGLVNDLDLQVTDPSSVIHYPDNASQKPAVSTLAYDSGSPVSISSNDRRAMKFTPSSYPANVESTTFFFYNPYNTGTDVDIAVYDDDGSGGLPGTELFRKTLTYVPTGWITIGITGVVISSGDFYVAIEKNDATQYIAIDDDGNPTARSYYHNNIAWVLSGYTVYIRANVRGVDYATSFDRVNNVVGLTLNNPLTGTYSIRISGYNIPQGPQPYALVVSGNVIPGTQEAPVIDDISPDGCISELCTYTISVTAHDPEGGELTYTWEALDGGTIIGEGTDVEFEPPGPSSYPDCDSYRVKVTVTSDASGLSADQTIDIYVKLAGDVDGNGVVNVLDKVEVRDHFGESGDLGWVDADVNCDGVVNILDKVEVRNQFGQTGCSCP